MANEMIWETIKGGAWIDGEFLDYETGEVFFVELQKEDGDTAEDFIAKCQEVADVYFSDAEFVRLVDKEEAEMLGYDTY